MSEPWPSSVFVIGTGGHALSVIDALMAQDVPMAGIIGPATAITHSMGLDPLSDLPDRDGIRVVIAVGDNYQRHVVAQSLRIKRPDVVFPVVIHPMAVISATARIAPGCVVLGAAVVGPGVHLNEFVLVGSGSVVEHQSVLANSASLGPNATLAGRCQVGVRTAIGMGASVLEGLSVANDVVIGASSFVNRQLPSCVVAYGVPARVARRRRPGEQYLTGGIHHRTHTISDDDGFA